MTPIEKQEFIDRMKALDSDEVRLALHCFPSKAICMEILNRLMELEKKFKEVRTITK